MIDFVRGKLVEKQIGRAVVETGGIGYSILISSNTAAALPQVGENVRLHTYLYVREDQLTLYGFARTDERDLFLTLISISGIGGKKMALDGIGTKLNPDTMKKWIKTPKNMKADTTMKPYPNLPEKDLNDLIEYLMTLR